MLTDEIRALIDAADVVSFDVFDTLLLRRHYTPAGVFAQRGRWFRLKRIAAEWIARLRHRQDVSLAQIYAVLRESPEEELLAERASVFANPAVRPICEYAVARGKPVIAISDMYLPSAIVRDLLDNAGYSAVTKIYMSCEAGVTKRTGGLFRHVADDLRVAPDKLLHFGDHPIADVTRAREQGLRAHHLPSPRLQFEASCAIHPALVRSLKRSRKGSHELLLGLLRDGLTSPRARDDASYAWGFAVAGPVTNALIDEIRRRHEQEKPDVVFFVDPDGRLTFEAFAIRHPAIPAQCAQALPSSGRPLIVDRHSVTASSPSIHEGALDFTRRLAELEAAGFSIPLSRADVALFQAAPIP